MGRLFSLAVIVLGFSLSCFGCLNNLRVLIFLGLAISAAGVFWNLMLKDR